MSHNQEQCFKKLLPGAVKIYGLTLTLPINFVLKIRESCIQNFHLGSYIVRYTVGNLLSCQPRVIVASCFVCKVISKSIDLCVLILSAG